MPRRTAPLILLLALPACAPPEPPEPPAPGAAPGAAADAQRRCFRQAFVSASAPGLRDVLSLELVIEGERAYGEYRWLPAEKDAREGRFEGRASGDDISATYDYLQEGQAGTSPISIHLDGAQAVIAGGDAALGLAASLPEVDC